MLSRSAALVTAALAALLLAANALPAAAADPAAVKLATVLKAQMKQSYQKTVPGIAFTKVTCTLAQNHSGGHCRAGFALASQKRKGVYQVAIAVDTTTGTVRWRATSVACTSLATGKKVAC